MSLNLNSLLNEYDVRPSILGRFFWQKGKQEDGLRYPLPVKSKYVDFVKLILGLHIIEIDQLNSFVNKLVIETSFPDDFASIIDRLESLFLYLTDSRIKLEIVPCSAQPTSERLDENSSYEKIILFSGGLDSLCGAIEFSKQHPMVLAHCRTNQVIFHRILELSQMSPLRRLPLFCFDAMTRSTVGGLSNTRGLLFLSFAYAVAESLGIKTIMFCENGSQMLDVMLGSLVYPNKPATKNTNPIFIRHIEELFSLFDNKNVRIERPFQDFTKAEMLCPLRERIKFERTFSCFTTRGRSVMCGICYNCFMRRMSLLAIDVQECPDTYEKHPFKLVGKEEQTESYEERLRILFHVLRHYARVIREDSFALNEVKLSTRDFFEDPIDLSVRTAKDIFLGVMKSLETIEDDELNALGKKAKELLAQIDRQALLERSEELAKRGFPSNFFPS